MRSFKVSEIWNGGLLKEVDFMIKLKVCLKVNISLVVGFLQVGVLS